MCEKLVSLFAAELPSSTKELETLSSYTAIISCEAYSTADDLAITKLFSIFSSVSESITFIGVKRSYDEMVMSLYSEGVKSGISCDYNTFQENERENILTIISSIDKFESIAQNNKNAKCINIPYSDDCVRQVILEISNKNIAGYYDGRHLNKSLPSSAIPFLRLFNTYCACFNKTEEGNLYDHLDHQNHPELDAIIEDISKVIYSTDLVQAKHLIYFITNLSIRALHQGWNNYLSTLHEAACYLYGIDASIPLDIEEKKIPDDFNPYVYLLLNPDVLKSLVNPYYHFIKFGINENRRWNPNLE